MVGDWMVGVVDMLVPLLESPLVRVLVYSGQNDVILGAPLTEQFLNALDWSGAAAYRAAAKQAWHVDTPATANDHMAGYLKVVGGSDSNGTDQTGAFVYAVVRGAGHMVPTDQPERAYDLITRFVEDDWANLH